MEPQCLVCLVCGKEASWYKVKKSLKDLSSFPAFAIYLLYDFEQVTLSLSFLTCEMELMTELCFQSQRTKVYVKCQNGTRYTAVAW